MLSLVASLFTFFRQEEFLEVEAATHSGITLRCGRALTVFDRLSRAVTRNGKLISTFGAIQQVRVAQEELENGRSVWSVSLRLTGSHAVQIGRLPDAPSASTVAEKIGAITRTRVIA